MVVGHIQLLVELITYFFKSNKRERWEEEEEGWGGERGEERKTERGKEGKRERGREGERERL